jgi:hypothetical protein
MCAATPTAHAGRWIFQQLVVTIEYLHKKGLSGRAFDHTNILLLVRDASQPRVKAMHPLPGSQRAFT